MGLMLSQGSYGKLFCKLIVPIILNRIGKVCEMFNLDARATSVQLVINMLVNMKSPKGNTFWGKMYQ